MKIAKKNKLIARKGTRLQIFISQHSKARKKLIQKQAERGFIKVFIKLEGV